MMSELIERLRSHAADPRFGVLIAEAIDFVSLSSTIREDTPSGPGQPAESIAKIHAFRKRSGYYAKASIVGLDETIEALSNGGDTPVRLGVIETNRGTVAAWLDARDVPLGLLILKAKTPPLPLDSVDIT